MRYYNITFTPGSGSTLQGVQSNFTSHPGGIFNPGCLEVEFDITNAFGHFLGQPLHLRIHNPTLEWVNNARNYNGSFVTIEAGLKSGLPLANPNQSGVIAYGIVWNSFANWIGTDLTLDFLVYPASQYGSPDLNYSFGTGPGSPSGYSFSWGQQSNTTTSSLLDAISDALTRTGLKLNEKSAIDSRLSSPPKVQYSNFLTTFTEFAKYINDISIQAVAPSSPSTSTGTGKNQDYNGVWLGFLPDGSVLAYDGTTAPGSIQLEYQEFIGQPTWLTDGGVVQSVHPMRNDIGIGFDIQYPKNLPTSLNPLYSAAGRYNALNASAQTLRVQQVRHVGKFRDTSPTGWVTYVNAAGAIPANSYPTAP
jgi:hypothetical protein